VAGGGLLQILHQRGHLDAAIGLALVGPDRECIFPNVHISALAFWTVQRIRLPTESGLLLQWRAVLQGCFGGLIDAGGSFVVKGPSLQVWESGSADHQEDDDGGPHRKDGEHND